MQTQLQAISPIDGRYKSQVIELQKYFSEYALMESRLTIEIEWLKTLLNIEEIQQLVGAKSLSQKAVDFLNNIIDKFDISDAEYIKALENTIKHDVKSVEYFIKEKISKNEELKQYREYVHFACTSDDINNLAYALMIKSAKETCIIPAIENLLEILISLAIRYKDIAMLSRTHGQPATPTTVGKEFANIASRLKSQKNQLSIVPIMGKFNGTVGNFSAHYIAFPDINWIKVCQNFVEGLGLKWNLFTTQIEPHDYIAEICHALIRCNNIIIDLNKDIWGYITLSYFVQKPNKTEVGSSIMPHKINPIDFENAEGNLGIANALLDHFANKLPISRWQRDLSDSTVLRNLGVGFAHALIAFKYTVNGLKKIEINENFLLQDLNTHWEILAEAIQTVMRSHGIENSYEKLKSLTRGKALTKELILEFINELKIPANVKKRLIELTPSKYIGKSSDLTESIS